MRPSTSPTARWWPCSDPSGSGKTTLLRVIAGFEVPDAGTVSIGGRMVAGDGTWVEPDRRRVGMVFQDGALFPHLTVADNVGFGKPRQGRVEECLQLIGLADRVALVPPRAVGRRAPAGRPGPSPRHRAGGGPARRALRVARRRAADHAAGGGRGHPARRRRQRPAGDPRPAGGPLVGRHRGAHARRVRGAGRLSRGGLRRAGDAVGGRVPRCRRRRPGHHLRRCRHLRARSLPRRTARSRAVRSTCWCAPRPWSSAPTPNGDADGRAPGASAATATVVGRSFYGPRPARVARAGERAPRAQSPARLRGLVARRSGEGLGRGPGPGARTRASLSQAAGGRRAEGRSCRPGRDGRRSI